MKQKTAARVLPLLLTLCLMFSLLCVPAFAEETFSEGGGKPQITVTAEIPAAEPAIDSAPAEGEGESKWLVESEDFCRGSSEYGVGKHYFVAHNYSLKGGIPVSCSVDTCNGEDVRMVLTYAGDGRLTEKNFVRGQRKICTLLYDEQERPIQISFQGVSPSDTEMFAVEFISCENGCAVCETLGPTYYTLTLFEYETGSTLNLATGDEQTITYDEHGQIKKITKQNDGKKKGETYFVYDSDGKAFDINTSGSAEPVMDESGYVASVATYVDGNMASSFGFTYDSHYRFQRIDAGSCYYKYDYKADNALEFLRTMVLTSGENAGEETYFYSERDERMKPITSLTLYDNGIAVGYYMEYDENGNLSSFSTVRDSSFGETITSRIFTYFRFPG